MFLGHYAVGFGSKKAEPKVSLGTYFMAAVFLDLLWPVFLLLGLEHVKIDPGNTPMTPLDFYDYPLSHSLLMAIVWSLVFGGFYYLIKKNGRVSVVLGICVFSHWILDFISHRPDLPLAPGVNYFLGLGLWYSVTATLLVELSLYAIGIYLYIQITKAKNKIGSIALWGFIALSLIIYFSNLFSTPPDVKTMAISGMGQWLFVLWAYLIDRHRTVV
jgi:hypothetical protein